MNAAGAFEVNFASSGCTNLGVLYDNVAYTLTHIEFHTPSEHSIGGGRYSAEAQFYHQNSAGDVIASAVFLQTAAYMIPGANNDFLNEFWTIANYNVAQIAASVTNHAYLNPYASFTPARGAQYVYSGSSTTPDCSTAVKWFIYDEPVGVSNWDLNFLRSSAAASHSNVLDVNGNNNRPTQSLNGRSVWAIAGGVVVTPSPSSVPTLHPTLAPTLPWKFNPQEHMSDSPKNTKTHIALILSSIAICLSGIILLAVFAILIYLASRGSTNIFSDAYSHGVQREEQEHA